jgi:hypothetical protein
MKYAQPFEYLPEDTLFEYPRRFGETQRDWKERISYTKTYPEKEKPKLAQPLEYFNGDVNRCCPRLEDETLEGWAERAMVMVRKYCTKVEKKEEVMAPDSKAPGDDYDRMYFSEDSPKKKEINCDPLDGMVMGDFNEGNIDSKKRGTCARSNTGKVDLSLVPFHLLAGCARVLMTGSKKYAPWNWAKGGKWSTPMDCLLRHLFKWWFFGEELDKESGEHHLDHVQANLLFLIHYKDTFPDGDDRPEKSMTGFDQSLHLLEPRNEDQ